MLRPIVLSLAAVALVATILAPATAHAESGRPSPRCNVRILPNGVTVPANLPALVVDDNSSPGLTATVTLTPSGAKPVLDLDTIADPRAPGVTLFVPKAKTSVEIGTTYSVTYTVQCSSESTPTEAASSFTTSAEVALPTRIGAVRELADGRVVITPSVELAAYMPTARFEAYIDGASVGTTRYGSALGPDLEIALGSGYVTVGSAATGGGTASLCKGADGLEKHDVKLSAHVAGAATDPEPLTFSLGINCSTQPTGFVPDAGDDRGASGDEQGGGGCAVSGTGSLGGIAMLFGAAAGVAVLVRRRRRR
jgi:MYXO-CTERM domain-containing protein